MIILNNPSEDGQRDILKIMVYARGLSKEDRLIFLTLLRDLAQQKSVQESFFDVQE